MNQIKIHIDCLFLGNINKTIEYFIITNIYSKFDIVPYTNCDAVSNYKNNITISQKKIVRTKLGEFK